MRQDDLLRTIGLIYEAALDDRRWTPALEAIATLLGGEGAALAVDHRHAQLSLSTGLSTEILAAYGPYWHSINPIWPWMIAAPDGAVGIDHHILDGQAYRKSEFYNDYVLAQGAEACIGIKAMEAGGTTAAIAVHRARGRNERLFGDREARLATQLAPHLTLATAMNHRLAALREAASMGAEALDLLPQAAFILDPSARILAANRRAEALLRKADGLTRAPDGLHAARPAATAALRRLVAAAASGVPHTIPRATQPLERPSGRRPLAALVGPFRRGGAPDLMRPTPATAILLVNEPEAATTPSIAGLRQLYGLTPTEAALALAITRGEGIPAAAGALRVTPATARTHLRHVFDKTGTSRQAELVRLLLTAFNGAPHGAPGDPG